MCTLDVHHDSFLQHLSAYFMWSLFTRPRETKQTVIRGILALQRQEDLKLHFKASLGYRFVFVSFWQLNHVG